MLYRVVISNAVDHGAARRLTSCNAVNTELTLTAPPAIRERRNVNECRISLQKLLTKLHKRTNDELQRV